MYVSDRQGLILFALKCVRDLLIGKIEKERINFTLSLKVLQMKIGKFEVECISLMGGD